MAMKILGNSPRRGGRSEDLFPSASKPIGGAREFATFALLMLCFAITLAVVFGHSHRAVNDVRPQPTTSARRAVAPNPKPQAETAIASGENYAEWMTTAAGSLGNSAANVENVAIQAVVALVWDPALGLSNQIVGFVADSWVNPVTG